jgi:hypothetical protein
LILSDLVIFIGCPSPSGATNLAGGQRSPLFRSPPLASAAARILPAPGALTVGAPGGRHPGPLTARDGQPQPGHCCRPAARRHAAETRTRSAAADVASRVWSTAGSAGGGYRGRVKPGKVRARADQDPQGGRATAAVAISLR